ncbi:MAG: type II secretion system GspH family protein [Epsilonproteobacteria bacterium]|nr:type II secretion system GspH family protein [Campylobacterota bacterium]
MKKIKFRNAFTMIELLFVIVILGIVGGIALETIRQYYENIYRTQEYTKRVSQADHILNQLSKYFENAISSSIVNLDQTENEGVCYGPPTNGDNNDYTIAFVAPDYDSLRGTGTPGWSEDTLLGANNVITALDVDYGVSDTIITALYPASSLLNSAVYDSDSADVAACARFGLNGGVTGSAGYHRITGSTATTLTLNAENNATDGKRKYLLRTGYAFRVLDNGNFMMYTNFRPWDNERYNTAANRKENILGQNVAHFYADYDATDFMANANLNDRGLVWRLKVCMRGLDSNLSDSDAESQTICRERRVHVRY